MGTTDPGPAIAAIEAELAGLERIDQAPVVAARLREFLTGLPAFGFSGELATRTISRLNDSLTRRVVDLLAARQRLPPTAWCWLAMGSEGRDEQTLVSDQDNGLVFIADGAAEARALRELFLPFAQAVNAQLAACGFTLCPGQIMAGNPQWCLSYDEWSERFFDWVRCPDPTALLNATIFFDLRPLYGELSLGWRLRRRIADLSSDNPAFLHLMAANALVVHPPLGMLGDVVVDDDANLDLKKLGSRIFVDVARILALAAGSPAVNSFERLRQAGAAGSMQPKEVAAATKALSSLLGLRLERQAMASAEPGDSAFRPGELNEFDLAVLKESLRQARRLQQRLKLNYLL